MKTLKEILSNEIIGFPIVLTSENISTGLKHVFKKYNRFVEGIIDKNPHITINKNDS